MAKILVTGFGGMVPSGNPLLIQDSLSVSTTNALSRFGDLRPLQSDLAVQGAPSVTASTKTLFKTPLSGWFVNDKECNYVRLPLNRNDSERVYYTGDGAPKMKPLSGSLRVLGIAPPTVAPTPDVTVVDELTVDESAALASTHQTDWADGMKAVQTSIADLMLSHVTYADSAYIPASLSYPIGQDPSDSAYYLVDTEYTTTTSAWLDLLMRDNSVPLVDIPFGPIRFVGVKVRGVPKVSSVALSNIAGLKTSLLALTDPSGSTLLTADEAQTLIDSLVSYSAAPADGTSSLRSPAINGYYKDLALAINSLYALITQGTAKETAANAAENDSFYASVGVVDHINADYSDLEYVMGQVASTYVSGSVVPSSASTSDLTKTIKGLVTRNSKGLMDVGNVYTAVKNWLLAAGFASESTPITDKTTRSSARFEANAFTRVSLPTTGTVKTFANAVKTLVVSMYDYTTGRLSSYQGYLPTAATISTKATYVADVKSAISRVETLASSIEQAAKVTKITKENLQTALATLVYRDAPVYVPASTPVIPIEVSTTWVFTWVSDLGEESAPSPASAIVTFDQNDIAKVSITATPPDNVVGWRLYRSNTGTSSSGFQLVTKTRGNLRDGTVVDLMTTVLSGVECIPKTTTYVYDTAEAEYLAELCPSFGWLPPDAGTQCLTGMPNGIMAGFTGSTLMFCEPWKPYAWPVDYDKPLQYKIVGLCSFGQSLFVGTEGKPYIVTGSDSASMTEELLDFEQACVSARSIVALGSGVAYASPDGLCILGNGASPQVVTLGKINQADWQALNPSAMFGAFYDNAIYMFHNNGCLIYDLPTQQLFGLDLIATAAFADKTSDTLYAASGGVIYSLFKGTDRRTAAYKTKTWRQAAPTGFAWLRVVSTFESPVVVKIKADGSDLVTQTITNDRPVRIPALRAYEWKLEISTSASSTTFVAIYSTTDELKQVT